MTDEQPWLTRSRDPQRKQQAIRYVREELLGKTNLDMTAKRVATLGFLIRDSEGRIERSELPVAANNEEIARTIDEIWLAAYIESESPN